MKKATLLFSLIIATMVFFSCTEKVDTVKMTIASETRIAVAGAAPMETMLVKEGDATEWTYFYDNIEGFTYAPGYEYVLEVKKENIEGPIPADASSIKYTLVKEVSKTEKVSEGLPEPVILDEVIDFLDEGLEELEAPIEE